MMSIDLRPRIWNMPSASRTATSPVLNQPSCVNSAAVSLCPVPVFFEHSKPADLKFALKQLGGTVCFFYGAVVVSILFEPVPRQDISGNINRFAICAFSNHAHLNLRKRIPNIALFTVSALWTMRSVFIVLDTCLLSKFRFERIAQYHARLCHSIPLEYLCSSDFIPLAENSWR